MSGRTLSLDLVQIFVIIMHNSTMESITFSPLYLMTERGKFQVAACAQVYLPLHTHFPSDLSCTTICSKPRNIEAYFVPISCSYVPTQGKGFILLNSFARLSLLDFSVEDIERLYDSLRQAAESADSENGATCHAQASSR